MGLSALTKRKLDQVAFGEVGLLSSSRLKGRKTLFIPAGPQSARNQHYLIVYYKISATWVVSREKNNSENFHFKLGFLVFACASSHLPTLALVGLPL